MFTDTDMMEAIGMLGIAASDNSPNKALRLLCKKDRSSYLFAIASQLEEGPVFRRLADMYDALTSHPNLDDHDRRGVLIALCAYMYGAARKQKLRRRKQPRSSTPSQVSAREPKAEPDGTEGPARGCEAI